MDETRAGKQDSLPKLGRVTEMCREWLVREDGALAYRLQTQEISQHYMGNKSRNAQVREDFPCALDEQIREQQLAEQAAAVYQKMLAEQEELDQQIAKQLADKQERDERHRLLHDETVAQQLFIEDKLRTKTHTKTTTTTTYPHQKTNAQMHPNPNPQPTLAHDAPNANAYSLPQKPLANAVYANVPRCSRPMPLPEELPAHEVDSVYTEPYRAYTNVDDLIGVPIDEELERKIQEERDAELARQLQDLETSSEEFKLNRDRLLAMEAQDKELAKLLQERERAKVKRAKERARQKALAKKQAEQQSALMPEDSYSDPADLIAPVCEDASYSQVVNAKKPMAQLQEDCNYSFPIDAVSRSNGDMKLSPGKRSALNHSPGHRFDKLNGDVNLPVRPNQLDLRSPLNSSLKSKGDAGEGASGISSLQHRNIAMAIDPTYTRRNAQSPPSYDTSSSTMTSSTLSSSPGILPSPDISEDGEATLPYMPIQGQRRTGSMEKKKKKTKDGCKQQ